MFLLINSIFYMFLNQRENENVDTGNKKDESLGD